MERHTSWLSALAALTSAATASPDVLVGIYVTARRSAQTENMIGFFSCLCPLVLRCDHDRSFRSHLSEVRSRVLAARQNSRIPHEVLRHKIGIPALRVALIEYVAQEVKEVCGIKMLRPEPPLVSTMPWSFTVNVHSRNSGQECWTTFNAGAYEPAGACRFTKRLLGFLDVASRNPDLPMCELLAIADEQMNPLRFQNPRSYAA